MPPRSPLHLFPFLFFISPAPVFASTCHNKKHPAEGCSSLKIPVGLCGRCHLGKLNHDGSFEQCDEAFDIDDDCVDALNEYVNLNECDWQRREALDFFTSDPSVVWAQHKLDFFLYAICEEGCDCIPQSGADINQPEYDVHRGNCPAHAYYDICKLFPNIKLIHLMGTENDTGGLPDACPLLKDWLNSPASNNWLQNPDVELTGELEYFLERLSDATEVATDPVVWEYCFDVESKAGRILPFSPLPTLDAPYLGCYQDVKTDRALGVKLSGSYTVGQCSAACQVQGHNYAARQWKGECWCGSNTDYVRHGTSQMCDCGGSNVGNEVFCAYGPLLGVEDNMAPVEATITAPDTTSMPAEATTMTAPGTSTVLDTTFTTEAMTTTAPGMTTTEVTTTTAPGTTSTSAVFLGCYKDANGNRALPISKGLSDNTVETCTAKCRLDNFSYAGLQWKGECWCGEDGYDKHGNTTGCDCDGPNYGFWMFCAYNVQ